MVIGATTTMTSDYERANVLVSVARRGPLDDTLRKAYVDAAGRLWVGYAARGLAVEPADGDFAELTGRQLLVYVRNLCSDETLQFEYQLRARFPVVASVPPSSAYDYYNPQTRGEQAPVVVTVEQ